MNANNGGARIEPIWRYEDARAIAPGEATLPTRAGAAMTDGVIRWILPAGGCGHDPDGGPCGGRRPRGKGITILRLDRDSTNSW